MSNDNSSSLGTDNSRAQRELIAQLESKNKEIMREIARLRRQQEAEQMTQENPALINELRALRQRKGELEGHLGALQDSRRQLMVQLEGLMRMLKNQQSSSPRSTPNSSPKSGKSPPIPGMKGPQFPSNSASGLDFNHFGSNGTSSKFEDGFFFIKVVQMFICLYLIACKSDGSSIRANSVSQIDLHSAADSVTSAMTSLVRKLNAGKRDSIYSLDH